MRTQIRYLARLTICGTVCWFTVLSGSARSQAIDLAEVDLKHLMQVEVTTVSGASRYLQKISEAPASITIVTAADIRAYGHRTDVLASASRDPEVRHSA